jgi:cyclophilin family peptidyl-prolyl cis-trans isomerase
MKYIPLILTIAIVGYLSVGCKGGPTAAEFPPEGTAPAIEQETTADKAHIPPAEPVPAHARPDEPIDVAAETSPEQPAEHPPRPEETSLLDAAIYPGDAVFRIDYPIEIRLVLRNKSPEPVVLERNINFLRGFEINDTRLGRAKYDREEEKSEQPIIIPPDGFIGVRVDLGRHFPSLRKPGNYKIRWSDPNLGSSQPLDIVVTDYVLLTTDYGDIAFALNRMVVVNPPGENIAAFSDQFAPLELETSTGTITTGDVVVARQLDVERLSRGLPEREEFLNAGTPAFFVQLMPGAPSQNMKYTVFGRVFRGLDALNVISRARQARGSQGQKLFTPANEIKIKRAVLVEEDTPLVGHHAEAPEGARPQATLTISPPSEQITYGEPLNLRLTLSNPYDEPLHIPGELGIKKGIKIFKLEHPSGEDKETVRRQVNISEDFPETLLPLSGGNLGPGGITGVNLDVTDLCPAFAEGGEFEIAWEDYGIETEPLTIKIQKSLFARIITEKGTLEVILFEEAAPGAVARFAQLGREGFYDGLTFHRVIDTPSLSLVQSGSPTGDETGKAEGGPIPLEPGNRRFRVGTVGLARTPVNPDSGSSQYFIITKIRADGAAALFRRYTQIGQVKAARDAGGKPADFRAILGKIAGSDKVIRVEISEKKPLWNDREEP